MDTMCGLKRSQELTYRSLTICGVCAERLLCCTWRVWAGVPFPEPWFCCKTNGIHADTLRSTIESGGKSEWTTITSTRCCNAKWPCSQMCAHLAIQRCAVAACVGFGLVQSFYGPWLPCSRDAAAIVQHRSRGAPEHRSRTKAILNSETSTFLYFSPRSRGKCRSIEKSEEASGQSLEVPPLRALSC